MMPAPRYKYLPGQEGLKFGKKVKVKEVGPKKKGSSAEHDMIQKQLEGYLNAKRIDFVHIPDQLLTFLFAPFLGQSLQRNKALYGWLQGVKKKVSEYLCGFPDLLIFNEPIYGIEIKTGGAKQRKGQKKFAEKIEVVVVHSFEEGKEIIDERLYNG